jgi:hypothetical protein
MELRPILAVDLAALHRQEHRSGAGIAAHDIDVEAENLLGDDGEDQIARGRLSAPRLSDFPPGLISRST